MPPDEIDRQINAAAPAVLALVLAAAAMHRLWKWSPWHPKFSTIVKAAVALGLVVGAASLVHDTSTDLLAAGWIVLAVPVYLARRYAASADDRADRAQRLRQARGHERRRAPPPLPPGLNQSGGSP